MPLRSAEHIGNPGGKIFWCEITPKHLHFWILGDVGGNPLMAKLFAGIVHSFTKLSKINVASFVCVSRCSHNAGIRSQWILIGKLVKTSNNYKEILGFPIFWEFVCLRCEQHSGNHAAKMSGYEMREKLPQIWILGVVGGNPVMTKLISPVQIPADATIYEHFQFRIGRIGANIVQKQGFAIYICCP